MQHTMEAIDEQELDEWQAALDDVKAIHGEAYARALLSKLVGQDSTVDSNPLASGVYRNTYHASEDQPLPAQDMLGRRAEKINLWNAMAMVVRANQQHGELGGHISTYASSSELYRIGFDYFFQGDANHQGDLVYFQGHASPGMYARSFLEGRLTEANLDAFRQEAMNKHGLSSYPHPWLMPDYWQFPTVSMGLGPLQAIHQADWQHYLLHRGMQTGKPRRIWAFCGDGEMDEPESIAGLRHAAQQRLDNIFVINCNLQRLDGPVRGNGQIITELERLFKGCGWHVIKVMWSCGWDKLWDADPNGVIQSVLSTLVDGQLQALYAQGPQALLDYVAQQNPQAAAIIKQFTSEEIAACMPGGHDPVKVYSAYRQATETTGQPSVILAYTIKGYQLGAKTHSRNIAHNKKKMSAEDLQAYAQWCGIPLSEEAIAAAHYYRPNDDDEILAYVKQQRQKLGGYLPKRAVSETRLTRPKAELWQSLCSSTGDKAASTTMAFVRLVNALLRDTAISRYLVPIVADEARTFGMEGLFKKIGIYASKGQQYQPEDAQSIMSYQESRSGQLIQSGLTEAAALATWLAAATSYSTSNQPVIPMYIFYSMFGFQRVGDLLWAAGDSRARGFLFGATAGRTTLGGEGLQHNDGHSLVMASVVPNCVSYDPCYQYELAVIVAHGIQRMMEDEEDVYYYITLMNENYPHPDMPAGVESQIIEGMYPLANQDSNPDIQLLGSGAILREVQQAATELRAMGLRVCVYSVTSFTELARQAAAIARSNSLTGAEAVSHVAKHLGASVPVVAATDYVRAYAEQIRPYIQCPYDVLGTDGFGRSDTRERLRAFHGVNAQMIVLQSIAQLVKVGRVEAALLASLRDKLDPSVMTRDPSKV